MARPFYPYEADDPDLDWLISNFLYERPNYWAVDAGVLPLVLIPIPENLIPLKDLVLDERSEAQSRKKLPVP